MSLKTITYTVSDESRDSGKVFLITEMPADKAEKWAIRGFLSLLACGEDIPVGFVQLGVAAWLELGLRAAAKLPWDITESFLDDIFGCIQILPDKSNPKITRSLFPGDIEEPINRLKLRMEVFKLHVGFSLAELAQMFGGPEEMQKEMI